MWRNWLGGARDMYLARSRDGETFTNAEKLGKGTWQLNACPMDGGGLAIDQRRVVSAWRRDGTLYLAEPGVHEKAIGVGKDIALRASAWGLFAAWMDSSGLVVLMPASTQTVLLSKSGAAPALAALEDGSVLAAWEENGVIETRRVR
jgi:hypothetical protein